MKTVLLRVVFACIALMALPAMASEPAAVATHQAYCDHTTIVSAITAQVDHRDSYADRDRQYDERMCVPAKRAAFVGEHQYGDAGPSLLRANTANAANQAVPEVAARTGVG